MRKSYPINHEINLLIGEEEVTYIINGSISTWDDVYGEDADGNRGMATIEQEIDEWVVVDLNNIEIKDEEILKQVGKYYDENHADEDQSAAESNHTDN